MVITGNVTVQSSMTASNNLNTSSLNGGQLAGFRNRIINGAMDISQRGASFAAANGYTLDRWAFFVGDTGAATVTQDSDVPSSNEFQNSLRVAVTTADTSIAAGDYALIYQRIEGYNARDLIGKTFTLSFWVRSSKTGTHCVAFRNSVRDRSYVVEYTINASNTWEQKSVTVTNGLITAGTWNWTSGTGVDVDWALAAGSTYQTTANAWQTGNYLATANQVNCLDSNTNIFAITGVQLEVGSVATPFEHRPYGTELDLCLRYLPSVFSESTTSQIAGGAVASSSLFVIWVQFPVKARVAPTSVAISSASHFTVNPFAGAGGGTAASLSLQLASATCARLLSTPSSTGMTTGVGGDIYFNSASGYVLFLGCEL